MTGYMIDGGEIIIEPFWDKCSVSLRRWNINGIIPAFAETLPSGIYDKRSFRMNRNGVFISSEWANVQFEIMPNKRLIMTREINQDCSEFNEIVLSGTFQPGTTLEINCRVDGQLCTVSYLDAGGSDKGEYVLGFSGNMLQEISIEITSSTRVQGSLLWLMIRNRQLCQKIRKIRPIQEDDWKTYLKSSEYKPNFIPENGWFASQDELIAIARHMDIDDMRVKALAFPEPEELIGNYVNFWTDRRFARCEDYEKVILQKAPLIAVAGILSRDELLMRKAARYALSIAQCTNWHDSFICCTPGLIFEHKAFVACLCCEEIAIVMDLAGEFFTDAGKEFLNRRLGEEGLGIINRNVWRYSGRDENIFKINQLAWFSRGRLPAYVTLEKCQPAITPYVDLALEELLKSLDMIILPDGGYDEGMGYFTAVAYMALIAIKWYAASRGIGYRDIVPQKLLNTVDFAEVFISLDDNYDIIPIGDTRRCNGVQNYAMLASLMPESHWVELYWRSVARGESGNEVSTGMIIPVASIPPRSAVIEKKVYRSFINMHDTCVVCSVRQLGDSMVKIVQAGGRANANHAHYDKGGFVLQFGGETIIADPGIGEYGHSVGASMGGAQWHSIVLPVSKEDEIVSPINPKENLRPNAYGDEVKFHSFMDLLPTWDRYFSRLTRELDSNEPHLLTVIDHFEVEDETQNIVGIQSSFITPLEIYTEGNELKIVGEKTIVFIKIDREAEIKIERLPEYGGVTYSKLIVIYRGTEGKSVIEFKLSIKSK